jgi:hypothetical protein
MDVRGCATKEVICDECIRKHLRAGDTFHHLRKYHHIGVDRIRRIQVEMKSNEIKTGTGNE